MKIIARIIWQLISLAAQASSIAIVTYFLFTAISAPVDDPEEIDITSFFKTSQPAFYFSILPRWYPGALTKLENSPVKRQGIHLMRKGWTYKEWLQLQSDISLINLKKGSISELEKMRYLSSESALKQGYMDYISWLNDNEFKNIKLNLQQLIFKSHTMSITSWIPVFHWWGSKNRFHQYLFQANSTERNRQWDAFSSAFGWSLILGLFTLFIAGLSGTIWAYIMSKNEDPFQLNKLHFSVRLLNILAQVIYIFPIFGIATILIPIFSTDTFSPYLNWFPGVGSYLNPPEGNDFIFNFFYYLFFPALILSLPLAAGIALRWYTGIKEEMRKKYFYSLYARGLKSNVIIRIHIMKNVSLPMLWYLAMLIPALISGTLIIENIFAIPGLGRLTFQAVQRQDIFTLLIITWSVSLICLTSIKIVKWFAPKIDPRVVNTFDLIALNQTVS